MVKTALFLYPVKSLTGDSGIYLELYGGKIKLKLDIMHLNELIAKAFDLWFSQYIQWRNYSGENR